MARGRDVISIDITGVIQIEKKLGKLAADMRGTALKEAVLAGANVLAEGIRTRMPKATGESAKSVTAQLIDAEPGHAKAAAGPDREHTGIRFKEYGFHDRAGAYHPPTPFMRPTADEDGDKAKAAAAEVLRRHVEGV